MRSTKLAALIASALIALSTQAAAHATPAPDPTPGPAHVGIYLADASRHPDVSTTVCGQNGPVVHTALFNDHFVPPSLNIPETVAIYREDGGWANEANWTLVWGPQTVQPNTSVLVALPYGPAYNAFATAVGNWPAHLSGFPAMLTANPPTADNAQLFAPGTPNALPKYEYAPAPADCPFAPPTTPPTTTVTTSPKATPTTGLNCDNGDPSEKCPTTSPATPSTTPTTNPTTGHTTSVPGTTPPTTPAGSPTATTTVPENGGENPTPGGPQLAHTGASVAPWAIGGAIMVGLGGLLMFFVRGTSRRH